MIYESSKMRLLPVATRFLGEVNDCYICRDLSSSGGALYTVLVIHDHEVVRNVLEMFRLSDRRGDGVLTDDFSAGEDHVLVFPYYRERPLDEFYSGETMTLEECEEVCMNAILSCITSDLPYPVLYLLLTGGQLQIAGDHSIFFGYEMDFSKLNPEIGESECTRACARILLTLLEPKAGQKAVSYYLLERKTENGSYSRFTDLYRDITIAGVGRKKVSLFARIRLWFRKNSDRIIGSLFWLSVILAVIALSILLSRAFLNGNSWIRLLFNTFKQIGNESLVQ